MMDAAMVEAARRWLTYACLAGLAAVVLIVFCSAVLPPLCEAWRRVRAKSRAASVAFTVGAVAAILYAGTKPTAQVTWDEYFSSKSYSIDSNDLRRISIAWAAPAWMPETANAILRAYSRTAGVSDVDPAASASMSAGAMDAVMPYEATNYVYFVECDWTPAPAVVTNGVYHVRAVENNERYVPIGVKVVKSITALSYVQDGLIAMWDGIERGDDPLVWRDLSGNGYDLRLNTSAAQVLTNGVMRRQSISSHNPIAVIDYGGEPPVTLEMCITMPTTVKNWSQVLLAVGAITSADTTPCLVLKAGSSLEWSYRWNSNAVIKPGDRVTLSSTKTAGFINGRRFTGSQTDTWGFPNGKVSILGDARATNYGPLGVIAHCIRIYNRALTADEIAANHEIDRIRFNLP